MLSPQVLINHHPEHGSPLDAADADLLGADAPGEVGRWLGACPRHRPTRLVALPGLAASLGLAGIHAKDEGGRLGLGSFKALGGAYAVMRLVAEKAALVLGREIMPAELRSEAVRAVASGMTFACATDGNHGRSVAAGARLVGAGAAIFVHAGVSEARSAAIAGFGARVIRVEGTYDDSVVEAARVAEREGWITVSDTSWPGYERIPGLVMQGYTAMIAEARDEAPLPFTHVFVQAGVGGLAAAVAGHLALTLGEDRPTLVVVEPARAACLLASAEAGQPVRIADGEPTVMAMLECYEPSAIAWRVLVRTADAFIAVDEEEAIAAMRQLAQPMAGDPAIIAGESGGAGLSGLIRACADPVARETLGLDGRSHVLLIVTEGATDPARFEELVGLAPATVAGAKP